MYCATDWKVVSSNPSVAELPLFDPWARLLTSTALITNNFMSCYTPHSHTPSYQRVKTIELKDWVIALVTWLRSFMERMHRYQNETHLHLWSAWLYTGSQRQIHATLCRLERTLRYLSNETSPVLLWSMVSEKEAEEFGILADFGALSSTKNDTTGAAMELVLIDCWS